MAEMILPSEILNFVIDSRMQLTSSGIKNIISSAVKKEEVLVENSTWGEEIW